MKGTDTFVNAARLLKCYHFDDDSDDVTPALFHNSIVVVGKFFICHMNPYKKPLSTIMSTRVMISFMEL